MRLTPRLALLLLAPPLLWAGNAVVGRLMVGQVPPLTLNLLRWLLAALLLWPLGRASWRAGGGWSAVRPRWLYLGAIGVLGVGLYNALQYLALVSSTPINVTLVASSMPLFTLAIGALAFGERPTGRQLLGTALGLAGVMTVIGRGSLQTLLAVRFVPGDLYILLATLGWALYSWLLARPPASMQGETRPRWDWAAFQCVQMAFGIPAAALLAGAEQTVGATPIQWSWGVAAALAYVCIGPSIIAYRCWGLGVMQAGPTLAAFFANLTPLLAALLSALVLGEAPRPFHALAFALIVGGIWMSSSKGSQGR